MDDSFDIAIAGGGLAGGLIALALARQRPDLQVALVEQGERFGGNHLWSFFASDIEQGHRVLLDPLIAARWDDGHEVIFPRFRRHLPAPYRSILSERLDRALRDALPAQHLLSGATIASLDAGGITLTDGRRIVAGGIIDARGFAEGAGELAALRGGWQKFVGRMLTLAAPHGIERPVIMDASVAQHDGYRFVYLLPFSKREIFVEDTYYSDAPDLDRQALSARIDDYAAARGWRVLETSREEAGVLPVVADGDFAAFIGPDRGFGLAGVRAGLFQPLTSYSLPDAVRFAHLIAALPRHDSASLSAASRNYARRHWRERRFHRMLAAMLFGAAEPAGRYRVLQRFYTLPAGLIERFYAGRDTAGDRLRILAGKPPVPVWRALRTLTGREPLPRLEIRRDIRTMR